MPGTIIITHQPKSTVPFKIERRDEAGNITDTHSTPTIEHAAEFVVGLARPGDAITGAGEPYFDQAARKVREHLGRRRTGLEHSIIACVIAVRLAYTAAGRDPGPMIDAIVRADVAAYGAFEAAVRLDGRGTDEAAAHLAAAAAVRSAITSTLVLDWIKSGREDPPGVADFEGALGNFISLEVRSQRWVSAKADAEYFKQVDDQQRFARSTVHRIMVARECVDVADDRRDQRGAVEDQGEAEEVRYIFDAGEKIAAWDPIYRQGWRDCLTAIWSPGQV